MPNPEDISQLAPPEGAQETQVEETKQPEIPIAQTDPYRIKYRGEEREVPRDLVDNFAPYLGTNPTGVVNLLQRAQEANRIWNENVRLQQERDSLMQELEAARQARMGGFQPPQAQPTYAPPTPQYATPPYGLQQPAQDDPMAILMAQQQMLRQMQQDFQGLRSTLSAEQERLKEQAQEQALDQQTREIDAMAERFLGEHNKGRKEQITKDEFIQEVMLSGGSNRYVPLERAFDRAWRIITYDERGETAQRQMMDKLRDPRAQVIVPGASPAQPPTADKRSDAEKALAGMTWGQGIEFIPEARR